MDTLARHFGSCIVVAVASGLQELHRQADIELDLLAGNDGSNDKGEEDNQQYEVQDGVTDYSALAKLGLLQRVDRRTDLTTTGC